MKTHSVRFFKRLILLVLALMIIIPTVLAICFGVKNAKLEKRLAALEQGNPVQGDSGLQLGAEAIDYQLRYPELYSGAKLSNQRLNEANVVYLTFDCLPSETTLEILDILDEYKVPATFFVMGTAEPEGLGAMKEIVDRGYAIGLSSYSSSYTSIYASVSSYLDDFKQIYDLVEETTAVKAEIFRFPGGSINAYNSHFYRELNAEMLRRGFVFFDSNVSGGGTSIEVLSGEDVAENVLSDMEGKARAIIDLQDILGKEPVVEALPMIIEGLQEKGYDFGRLTASVAPIVYSYASAS